MPGVQEVRSSGVHEFRSSGVQEFRSSGVQEFRSSGVQEFRSSGVQGGRTNKIARKMWGWSKSGYRWLIVTAASAPGVLKMSEVVLATWKGRNRSILPSIQHRP